MGIMTLKYNTFLCVSIFYFFVEVSVSAHVHNHKDKNDLTKEREQDGIYNARDSKHYLDDEHRSEYDHEAIIGSRSEAETFHKMNEEEAKKRLETFFHKMDKNQDQFVDKLELIQWVLKSFRSLTMEEAIERFEEDDDNEDGKVTWEEHVEEAFGMFDDEFAGDDELEEEKKQMRESEELFKAADVNQDSVLDKEEYPAFSNPEEFEQMHDLLYKQALREKDRDGDGFVSMKEFLQRSDGVEPDKNSDRYLNEKDNFKSVYDLDEDGKLDREEILRYIIPDNEESATNEAEHLIQSADDDKDGKLSLKEVLDNHDTFVGSEVTGYGEQLQSTKDEL